MLTLCGMVTAKDSVVSQLRITNSAFQTSPYTHRLSLTINYIDSQDARNLLDYPIENKDQLRSYLAGWERSEVPDGSFKDDCPKEKVIYDNPAVSKFVRRDTICYENAAGCYYRPRVEFPVGPYASRKLEGDNACTTPIRGIAEALLIHPAFRPAGLVIDGLGCNNPRGRCMQVDPAFWPAFIEKMKPSIVVHAVAGNPVNKICPNGSPEEFLNRFTSIDVSPVSATASTQNGAGGKAGQKKEEVY